MQRRCNLLLTFLALPKLVRVKRSEESWKVLAETPEKRIKVSQLLLDSYCPANWRSWVRQGDQLDNNSSPSSNKANWKQPLLFDATIEIWLNNGINFSNNWATRHQVLGGCKVRQKVIIIHLYCDFYFILYHLIIINIIIIVVVVVVRHKMIVK